MNEYACMEHHIEYMHRYKYWLYNLITGQQAPGLIPHICLYAHYLECVTKGHIAIHTILFLNLKILYSVVS